MEFVSNFATSNPPKLGIRTTPIWHPGAAILIGIDERQPWDGRDRFNCFGVLLFREAK
jgi:hypothetical protein